MTLRAWPGPQPPIGVPWQINRRSPQAMGLVGWWPFIARRMVSRDETGRTGMTMSGDAAYAVAQGGPGVGTTSTGYITATGGVPELANAVAATLFVNVTRPALNSVVTAIGSVGEGATYTRFGFLWYSDSKVYCTAENGQPSFPSASVALSGCHQICLAFDGSRSGLARLRLYVDGAETALTAGGVDPASVLHPGAAAFDIGREYNPTYIYSTATFHDVRIYNRALSAAEVWQMWAPSTRWDLYGVQVARRGPVGGVIWPGIGPGVIGGGVAIGRAA